MQDSAPALWLVIVTGAATGLLASIVGYALLGLPLVKVRTRHDLHVDDNGPRVESYVVVANVRGRPVKIDHVWIVNRRPKGGEPGMGRPKDWEFPHLLSEGQAVRFPFDRAEFPRALAVAIDSADRIWPRRRWLRVKRRALQGGPYVGWPWQRNGPTERQIERTVQRIERLKRERAARASADPRP
jgi:hypothetical protein